MSFIPELLAAILGLSSVVRLLWFVSGASIDMVCSSTTPTSELLVTPAVAGERVSRSVLQEDSKKGSGLRVGVEEDAGTKIASLLLGLESPAVLQGWAAAPSKL